MTHRNDHLSLATYPKDTIWGDGDTAWVVYFSVAHSLEVNFLFEIGDTKDTAWYIANPKIWFLLKISIHTDGDVNESNTERVTHNIVIQCLLASERKFCNLLRCNLTQILFQVIQVRGETCCIIVCALVNKKFTNFRDQLTIRQSPSCNEASAIHHLADGPWGFGKLYQPEWKRVCRRERPSGPIVPWL